MVVFTSALPGPRRRCHGDFIITPTRDGVEEGRGKGPTYVRNRNLGRKGEGPPAVPRSSSPLPRPRPSFLSRTAFPSFYTP